MKTMKKYWDAFEKIKKNNPEKVSIAAVCRDVGLCDTCLKKRRIKHAEIYDAIVKFRRTRKIKSINKDKKIEKMKNNNAILRKESDNAYNETLMVLSMFEKLKKIEMLKNIDFIEKNSN